MKRVAMLMAMFSLVTSASVRSAGTPAEKTDDVRADLHRTLAAFGDKHGLAPDALARLLTDSLLRTPHWRQGGIGLLEKDTYIELDAPSNRVQLDPETHWSGAASDTIGEIVVLNGQKVLGSFADVDPARLRILVFEPAEVGFIEWGPRRGGIYRRFIQ